MNDFRVYLAARILNDKNIVSQISSSISTSAAHLFTRYLIDHLVET